MGAVTAGGREGGTRAQGGSGASLGPPWWMIAGSSASIAPIRTIPGHPKASLRPLQHGLWIASDGLSCPWNAWASLCVLHLVGLQRAGQSARSRALRLKSHGDPPDPCHGHGFTSRAGSCVSRDTEPGHDSGGWGLAKTSISNCKPPLRSGESVK